MSHFEDKILVKTFLLTRSELLFRQLYRKHTLAVYRLALQLTDKNMVVAEDIIQEAWIRAIERLQAFKWESSFKTWLSGIVINCCREHNRKKNAIRPTAEYEQDTITEHHDSRIDLANALALLPAGYREILVLHDMEGFKHEEIGRLLNISEGTSKSQLFHARKAIRKLLN